MLPFQLLSELRAGWLLNILSFSPALLIDNVVPNVFLIGRQSCMFTLERKAVSLGPRPLCREEAQKLFPRGWGAQSGRGNSASASSQLGRGKRAGWSHWSHRSPEPVSGVEYGAQRTHHAGSIVWRQPRPHRTLQSRGGGTCGHGAPDTVLYHDLLPHMVLWGDGNKNSF